MKKSRFSEEQKIGIIREGESGNVGAVAAKHNIGEGSMNFPQKDGEQESSDIKPLQNAKTITKLRSRIQRTSRRSFADQRSTTTASSARIGDYLRHLTELAKSAINPGQTKDSAQIQASHKSPLIDAAGEIRRLQREVEYLRRQRDILKKAMSILSEEPASGVR